MPSEACIGRVGGLAVALGVGVAIVTGWGDAPAWADDSPGSTESPTASKDSGPKATPDSTDDAMRPRPSATTDKPRHRSLIDTVRRAVDDAVSLSTPTRKSNTDRRSSKSTTTRGSSPERSDDDVKDDDDAAQTAIAVSRPVPETVIHVADVVAPTVATQPSIATTRPAQPSPPVVAVATRVVSEVANAVLTPLTATPTPGTPADPPSMWALMAFARREFEFAVRSPSMAGRPADAQTTSETMVADAAVEPEKRTLVLTAFPAEADAILARTTLDENPVVVVDGRHYYLGTLGGKKVIVAMTGIGMENAADTTETALTHFTPESGVSIDAVVFAGVAGGSGRTQIGDVAVPAQWTSDDGATWHQVDPEMLAAAEEVMVDLQSTDTIADPSCRICGPLSRLRLVNLDREPQLYVGGDGSSDDNNNGAAFPSIPLGGAIFGPQPLAAPDFSPLFTGNFFRAAGPFLIRGVVSNITGFLTATAPPVDAVDQETAAAQQVADAHGVPFLGIRGMSDGPGDPLNLPGYPFTFFVYKQLAADNAAIVTEAFLQSWDGT